MKRVTGIARVPRGLAHVLAGLLVADFLTAAAHWFEDTYLPYDPSPTLLGSISRDNEMHHFIPFSITTGRWWDNMRVSVGLLLAIGVPLAFLAPRWMARHKTFLITAAVAMGLTNLLHRFQHERACTRPAFITALQRAGLLVSRKQHTVHHRVPDQKYGVLLGFTNRVYDGLGVWRGLEALLHVLGFPPSARKHGVVAYEELYDPWLKANMARPCPERLTKRQMHRYEAVLADAHARR